MEIKNNDQCRTALLANYDVMDTDPEEVFDRIARLATSICGMPIGTISFLDDHRQWFKSRIGCELEETSLEDSFCSYTIAKPTEVMIVPDATADSRFSKNPMVIEGPKVRFYAGAPIVTPTGIPVGAVCVLDKQPRRLSAFQEEALSCLAVLVSDLLERRLPKAFSTDERFQRACPMCQRGGESSLS